MINSRVVGPDFSKWEPYVDFNAGKPTGMLDFMFTKVSQGVSVDPSFATHWANAKAAGVARGGYHFYDPRYYSPLQQADAFVSFFKGDYGELPFVVDIEGYNTGPYHGASNWKAFIERVRSKVNKPFIVYTGYGYWNENGANYSYFAQFPLWVANYTRDMNKPPENTKYFPFGAWTSWLFHQYTDDVIANWVRDKYRETSFDMNVFNGSKESFEKLIGGEIDDPPPQEPTPGEEVFEYTCAVAAVNIRTLPVVREDTLTGRYAERGQKFKLRLWKNGTWTWGKIVEAPSVSDIGHWVCVTSSSDYFVLDSASPFTPGVTYPLPNVKCTKVRAYSSNCYVYEMNIQNMDVQITPAESDGRLRMRTTSEFANEFKCNIAFNGGDHVALDAIYGKAQGVGARNGSQYSWQHNQEPWLDIRADKKIEMPWKQVKSPYNAIALDRYLVVDGAPNPQLDNNGPHPRTCYGYKPDGTLVVLIADGRTTESRGLYVKEAAQLLIDHGCIYAGNGDGGGSTTAVINNVVQNVPIDSGIPGKERKVATHVGFVIKQGQEEDGRWKYQLTKDVSLRSGHSTSNPKIKTITAGSTGVATKVYKNAQEIWLYNGEGWFAIVYPKSDGVEIFGTYKVLEECTYSSRIKVKRYTLKNITSEQVPIYKHPNSKIPTIKRFVAPGEAIKVKDIIVPDTQGFGDAQKRWVWVVDPVEGFADSAKFSGFHWRSATGEHQVGNIRHIELTDGTCKRMPLYTDLFYTVPDEGNFWRGKHDWERTDLARIRNSPSTIPLWGKPDFYELRKPWQLLWYRLMKRITRNIFSAGELKSHWADITAERKALTDNHGLTHQLADYILGLYTNNPPMKQKGLVFAGTMVKRLYGSTIAALDPRDEPPTVDWLLKRPWLWGIATTSVRSGALTTSWPNFKRLGDVTLGLPVPYLILGYEGMNVVDRNHFVPLQNGITYSPHAKK